MKTYEIVWQACPHKDHPKRVARVEAETQENAQFLLKDAIRGSGVEWFSILSCDEYIKPDPVLGRVLSLGTNETSTLD